MAAPDFDWASLPEELRYGLLLGGEGQAHLAGLAGLAVSRPETAGLGLDLLLAAWEAGPLDGNLARALQGLDARAKFLSPGARAMVRAVAGAWREPGDTGRLAAMAARREHGRLLDFLGRNMRDDPGNLFWRRHLLDLCYLLADWETARLALDGPWPGELGPVREKFLGDVAFQLGDFEEAHGRYVRALALRSARPRLAQSLFRLGLHDRAETEWRKSHSQALWNANILLRLHDRLAGRDLPGPPLPGSLAVCLYTSGKASEIDATLAALFASELSGAKVVVLDNGSTDATPRVLESWRERAGEGLEVVRLPVNVGAPAARNWLAASPAVRERDFTAYLDDDARVPPDWTRRFAGAVAAYPGAGVWGCKVVDLAAPGRIQSAEVNLLDDSGTGEPAFASLCSQDLDFGQFDFVRPCLSVTGCCHLFRTDLLLETGDFDIRFSPTQYDDLDHDLRLAAKGLTAVYQGGLAVRHARLSGALLHLDRAATGVSLGNLRKLSGKHPPEERRAMRRDIALAMLRDLAAKADMVRSRA